MACDVERFKRFFHAMLAEGIYLAPSAFEAGFVSAAHSDADIEATVRRGAPRVRSPLEPIAEIQVRAVDLIDHVAPDACRIAGQAWRRGLSCP